MSDIAVVILAAGQGTRMKSRLPKVLHPVLGRPMIGRVLDVARDAGADQALVVVGRAAEQVRHAFAGRAQFVVQSEQLGTAHAVMQATGALRGQSRWVIVLYGDTPLMTAATVGGLLQSAGDTGAAMAALVVKVGPDSPFGRLVRDAAGRPRAIVEAVDCTSEQLAIPEAVAGAFCFDAEWLWSRLPQVPVSRKGEYYLTELAAMAYQDGRPVTGFIAADPDDALGVNTRFELAGAEAIARRRACERLMRAGVTIADPNTTYVEESVEVAEDVTVLPGSFLMGATRIGPGSTVGPGTYLVDAEIGSDCTVWYSVVEKSSVGDRVSIGPYSHLRPGSRVGDEAEIGNYAELKNASVGPRSKIHHFSYTGDATYGIDVNVGAGTITCNYDCEADVKSRTTVGDGACLGSDTLLVAPVTVGANAITAAGSVVTRNVAPSQLVLGVPARSIRPVRRERGAPGANERGGDGAAGAGPAGDSVS